jgi:putative addiction module CopG family antidote
MNLSLSKRLQKVIEDRVRSGRYASAEDVVAAALLHLEQHEQAPKFAPGELDALVSEGEADIAGGDVLELDEVFKQLRRMSDARRAAIPQKTK